MDYFGYLVSLIIFYFIIYYILKLASCIADKIVKKDDENTESQKMDEETREKLKIEKKDTISITIYLLINNIINDKGNRKNIKRLIKEINSDKFLKSEFSIFLNNRSISELNKLNNIIKMDSKKNKPIYENKVLLMILTALVTEIMKKVVNFNVDCLKIESILPYFKNLHWVCYLIIVIVLIILLCLVKKYLEYKESKKILLDHDYLISEIDLVIKQMINSKLPQDEEGDDENNEDINK